MESGKSVPGSVYIYAPNKVAPVVLAFLFSVSMIIHVWQCVHYKCWRVTFYLPWAALLFTAGYIVRKVGTFHIGDIGLYVASLVLVYVSPPVYEFCNYLILSRALYYVPQHTSIHPGRITTTYGVISVLIEVLNIVGAEYSNNKKLLPKIQDVGKIFVRVALMLQLFVLVSFALLAGAFHRRCARASPSNLSAKLKTVLLTLYCSSVLIAIRTVYRTVEYFSILNLHIMPGLNPNTLPPILRYEWYFWVFEATVMVTNSSLLNFNHPMKHLPRSIKTQLSEDGTEFEGPGYEDKRSTWQKFVDPFNLAARNNGSNN